MDKQQDHDAISGLFDRIEDVARNSAPRDRDAEVQIQERLQQFAPAPYYMAQTILIQEQALKMAQEKIEQLESQGQQRSGGFLGGLFGGDQAQPQQRQPAARPSGPWGQQQDEQPRRGGQGGGFLAGAAQTALGVTGGVLLGSALAGMLTGGAQAEEYQDEPAADEADAGGGDDMGGDDNFDMGGDF